MERVKKFCFIGHVDSGKSTIAGHLYAKCGGLSEHELEKIKLGCQNKKGQLWSRVFDIWEEEQEKGKTHEFNILELKYQNTVYQLIDTPGHKIFIRSLIEGITHFDSSEIIGCLIISMAPGEFESGWENGQTKEDIIITRAVGIKVLIVLINKMDLINWDKEKYDRVVKKITPFINNCRFKSVVYIPISGYDGINLIDKENSPDWYTGPSLIETMNRMELEKEEKKDIPNDKWTKMLIDLRILWAPSIIAPEFSCIMHFDSNEYEVVFKKFKTKKFLKTGDNETVLVESKKVILKGKPTRNVLFRYNDRTIGFGIIRKVG